MKEDYEILKEVVANSHNISEVCRQLGLVPRGGNHIRIKQKIQEYNLDTSHFMTGIWNKGLRYSGVKKTRSLEEILQNGVYYSSNKLKNRLLKSGLKEARCENCDLETWLGQPIKLELHHINGDHSDNRLENIQLLCPNCHAYTDTYRGKNIQSTKPIETPHTTLLTYEEYMEREKAKAESKHDYTPIHKSKSRVSFICKNCGKEFFPRHSDQKYCSVECLQAVNSRNVPSKEELLEIAPQHQSLESLGRHYGVTGNACKKWFKKYGIDNTIFQQKSYPILQYDLDGNFIREWKDGKEITNILGFNISKVQNVCRGASKTSQGFIWKYKKDIEGTE